MDINTLFDIAFGVRGVVQYRNQQQFLKGGGYDVTVAETKEEAERLSYLGTPILFPIKFIGKEYQVYNDVGDIVTRSFKDFELPTATIVNFRHPKIIRKTKLPAGNGTVKELYGGDDWQIDIKGICLADPSHAFAKTAKQQQEALIAFDKVFDAIEVKGDLFENKSIRRLVIENIQFNQLQGHPDKMPFIIRAVSDEPEELIL